VVVFTCGERWNRKIDILIVRANAVMHELYCFVVTKQLSSTTNLSVFKSVLVVIFAYGHELWIMTETVLPK